MKSVQALAELIWRALGSGCVTISMDRRTRSQFFRVASRDVKCRRVAHPGEGCFRLAAIDLSP